MKVISSRRSVRDRAVQARMAEAPILGLSGDCASPLHIWQKGLPDRVMVGLGLEKDKACTVEVTARCRACQPCLAQRRRLWTARAIAETKVSSRTWFGTLTLAPDRATQARMYASLRIQRRVSDDTEENHFKGMVKFVNPELQRFLKRVRKKSRFRYMLVTEAHQSGIPHWHLLIHEVGQSILKKELEHQWRYGFSHWRLVDVFDPRAAGYTCKYLSKTLSTKVFASRSYGSPPVRALTELTQEATRSLRNAVMGADPGPISGDKVVTSL